MKRTFDSYVRKTDSCWYWEGPLNRDGYGRYNNQFAHRITYLERHGKYPPNTVTDHLCRTRNCVNPDHLEAVSIAENVRRGRAAQATKQRWASVTHCKHGHELTPDNLYLEVKDTYTRRHCKTCKKSNRRRQYLRDKKLT